MLVLSYTMKSNTRVVCAKAVQWLLRKLLVVALLLLAGSPVSAQVIETINETGGTIADPGLKIEVLADGSFRVYRLGMSQTYEGTDDPRGIATFIGMNQTFTSDPRQVKQVTWSFISPLSGLGTAASPWRVQMVGNVGDYRGVAQHTVICNLSYVKDLPYYILDYTVAAITDLLTTHANLYLAEHAVLDATTGDWSGNSVCTKGLGPDYPGPYGTVGVYRDDPCGSYPTGRSHVMRMKDGFTSFMATDAAGMTANIPENCILANIYNNTYDGTENGIIVHKDMGDVFGGNVNAEKVYTARILSGYGSTMTDLDAVTGLDPLAPAVTRQLTIAFEKDTASGMEGDIRHSADNLKIKVYNGSNTQTIVVTAPLYVPVIAAPSGANPGIAGVDYECKRGIMIPPGSYNNTGQLISVDTSVMILGNTNLQNNRTMTLTLDNGVNNNLVKVNTSKNVLTYTIKDDESKSITLNMPVEVDEGQNASATVSLPSGVLAAADITVTLTRKTTSTTSASDVVLPASVVIKQNTNSATFTFQAQTDKILEYLETLEVQADATVLGLPQTASASVNIKDRTYDDPANRIITMRPVPGVTVTEPYNGGLQFSLPAGVTTDIPINITLGAMHADPQSTASASDYTIASTAFSISSGNSVTIPFTVIDDNLAEGTEKLHVTATATDVLSRPFDFTPYDIQILDDDANALQILPTAGQTEMTEGGATVTFTVSLPAGTTASADIPLSITLSGEGTAADISALPDAATFKIPSGANSATFTINALTDNLLEGDESLTLNGNSSDFTVKPYTITVKDATWSDPNNRKLQLDIISSAIKEGNNSALKVGFVNNIIAGKPIVVTLTHNTASVASATDYTLASTTITIPAGQREVTVPAFVTAQTDLILEKSESFTLDGASSDIPSLTVAPDSANIDDATGDNAVNKVITIAAQQSVMNEGTGYTVTYSLPAGITTEVPIHITPKTGTGSTAADADYSFAAIPPLDKGNPAVTGTINITADGLLEPDETLVLDGTSTDLPGITFTTASVTIKDLDYVAGMPITMTADNNTITEGSTTGALITLSLPAGKKTTYDIPVTITKDAASTALDGEHTALPTTVIIKQGTGSVTFPAAILASSDNLLEDDETIIIDQSAVGFTGSSLTITIKDGSNPDITVQPQPFSAGNKVAEGNSYTVRVALAPGITPYKPFKVTLTAGSASTAAVTDYSGLPVTVTISPGQNFKDITLSAISDNIIEPLELIRLKGTASDFTGLTVDSLDVFIDDVTSKDPSNLKLRVVVDSTTLHEGNNSKVTVGFVKAAITASTNISIGIAPDASFSAGAADYTGVPASVVLPAGTNQMQLTLNMVADNMVEGTEQLQLKATVPAPYTVTSPAVITIPEAPVQVLALKTADAAEPSTNGAFVIKLTSTQMAGKDVNITFTLGGTASAADWKVVPATAVIKAGTNSITIPVNVTDDKLVEGDETITLQLVSAKMGTITFPVDATVQTVVLKDDENNAAGRSMMIEKIGNAAEPSQKGSFRIRFSDPQLTVMRDVQVTYNAAGTAAAGSDYLTLPGTLTIPAGQNGVAVNITPIDDKLVEDTEFVRLNLVNVTSTMTGITWPLSASSQIDVPIVDNDTMKLDLFSTPATVKEGQQVQITLKSPSINTKDIPVALKVIHDAARTITTSVGSLNGNGDTLTVILPAGSTEYTFTITSFDNTTNDDEGFINLQIVPDPSGNLIPNYLPGLASQINVIVEDNDPLDLSFNAPQYMVNEGNKPGESILMVEVKLSRAASRPVTLPYQFSKTAGVSFIGTAVPGGDYDSIVKPIEIEPGQLIGYIPVSIIGDNIFERNDSFSIKLQQPSVFSGQNVPTVGTPDSALCIIINDDPFCPTCDTDGDGIPDGKEDRNGNNDPTDDDADNDGIPNYLDLDSDNDGVPDSVEGWITDGRWVNDNKGKIRVHPAISPNADGMGNDAMYVENIEKYPKNEVVIFNRWGGTVYKTSNYNNQDNNFKGLNNGGKEVTDGSYFYLIYIYDETGKKEQYAGFIVIKRK